MGAFISVCPVGQDRRPLSRLFGFRPVAIPKLFPVGLDNDGPHLLLLGGGQPDGAAAPLPPAGLGLVDPGLRVVAFWVVELVAPVLGVVPAGACRFYVS